MLESRYCEPCAHLMPYEEAESIPICLPPTVGAAGFPIPVHALALVANVELFKGNEAVEFPCICVLKKHLLLHNTYTYILLSS